MKGTNDDLLNSVRRIDGRGYKAYKDLSGAWDYGDFVLSFDHVQGDPFASPSAVSAEMPIAQTGLPGWALDDEAAEIATRDFLARVFAAAARDVARGHRGTGKGGLIEIDRPGQEILERSAVLLSAAVATDDAGTVRLQFYVGLPAHGRRIAGRDAAEMLDREVPEIVRRTLVYSQRNHGRLQRHVQTSQDAEALRETLAERNWVAFVADGAVLPRASGVDTRPMKASEAVSFTSPETLRETVSLPHAGTITGMAVPPGVTVICGGGYHGKSTLLDALSSGVYDHVPGDGRELVVASRGAVKIRAEDGRRIRNVSISPFINNLPRGRDTDAFSSEDASGSTSQAANIVEMIEVGADLLLIDEDTSATNFMIRDHRMQELISKRDEPITPFIDKVGQLHAELGISTILVIGGSGDYFDVADRVIAMREYEPLDVTTQARDIAERYKAERRSESGNRFGTVTARAPIPSSIDPSKGRRSVKTRSRGVKTIDFGTEQIDLSSVEQLVDQSQLNSIAEALVMVREKADGSTPLSVLLEQLFSVDHVPRLVRTRSGRLAAVRSLEVAAALNRLRTLDVRQTN